MNDGVRLDIIKERVATVSVLAAVYVSPARRQWWMGCIVGKCARGPEPKLPLTRNLSRKIYDATASAYLQKMYTSTLFASSDAKADEEYNIAPDLSFKTLDRTFSIDTSRAKSNKPVVSLCVQRLGLQEVAILLKKVTNGTPTSEPCDIYWHNVVYSDLKSVVTNANSKVNKFPGMTELAKKVALTRALLSMRQLFPVEYQFYPNSWYIPAQLQDFADHCERAKKEAAGNAKENLWYIVKPDEGAQGAGIYLIQGVEQIRDLSARQLIQDYVANPLLMSDGLKFDFRVYAVIKSINPLSIYVAREGMVRFCTEKYVKPTTGNSDNLYAHLTNYSLNKSNNSYVHSYSLKDQYHGSKRLLSSVLYQLESSGVNSKLLWHDIKMIIVKTVLAMVPEIMLNYEHYFCDSPGPQCFQIMGFDIIPTENGKPILLEVNSAPSLTIDHSTALGNGQSDGDQSELPKTRSVVDEAIKIPLVRDTILLVLDLLDTNHTTKSLSSMLGVLTENANCAEKLLNNRNKSRSGKKSHLSEIFPNRYRQNSGHLLFLDKAMYLFMQFVNLKLTTTMTIAGTRSFIRKCNLSNIIGISEAEQKFASIYLKYTGEEYFSSASGLPFHAFLELLYDIAELKFPEHETLLDKVQLLLTFCGSSLRHYGVRSARLRRAEIDKLAKENTIEIYLLPSRLAEKRASREMRRRRTADHRRFQRPRYFYGHSLPRTIDSGGQRSRDSSLHMTKNRNEAFVLPKLRPPFVFS